jgi:hypothetical protein
LGLRGPLPKQQIRSERLDDLTPPDWLGPLAREYWAKHADQLRHNQMLTVQTAESFAITCDLWQRVRGYAGLPTDKRYLDTVKSFRDYAKLFRLLPTEKPQVKESRFEDFGEVDFE